MKLPQGAIAGLGIVLMQDGNIQLDTPQDVAVAVMLLEKAKAWLLQNAPWPPQTGIVLGQAIPGLKTGV